ncbi:hypothetical protein OKJ48_16015 [Streptomyces kunmingensis]|uniref:Uncharacterized protein n=1 Tax=Streptomyces kunmingensis TaxID=68225 RepID=A0ABU6CAT5_9ACTN|nr:hypothetical protein [Streptomyces kunmingensis]MEB3961737.1 hypothetical protein [Streptomyces kunmingensis]
MATAWLITRELSQGREAHGAEPVARFEATREEARRRLYETACTHRFSRALQQQRREVFRQDPDVYHVQIEGKLATYHLRYCLSELVWSTDGPAPGHPSAGAAEAGDAVPDVWRAPDQ